MRWLGASAACACAAAIAAGLVEGILGGGAGAFDLAAAVGFVAIAVWPIAFVLGVFVRGAARVGRVDAAIAALVDEDGRAPRLAGWVAVIALALAAMGWSAFQMTWLLAVRTAWKPGVVGLAEPIIAGSTVVAIAILSRPAARAIAWSVRRADRRWPRARLAAPRTIAAAALVFAVAAVYLPWRFFAKPKLAAFDASLVAAPAAALAALIGAHVAWLWAPRARRVGGAVLGAATVACVGCAIAAARVDPDRTLGLWAERPLAGFAIERAFDLDAIRARVSTASFRPAARAGAAHPDIVLITLDGARADHTPPYGGRAEMPLLRDLAARGTVFQWAFAPSNVTGRSIASMVTGLQANRVRGRVAGPSLRLDLRHVTLAERLRAGGYDTAGFFCCDELWGPGAKTGLARGIDHVEIEPRSNPLARAALAWLGARDAAPGARKPLFVWVHLNDPHDWIPAGGPSADVEERRRAYDRALSSADAAAFQIVTAFSGRPPERAPVVIVTSDHGDELGPVQSSANVDNAQIRVPLVIAGPGVRAQTITETVSGVDLAATILDLAGFEPSGLRLDGHSLAGLATGHAVQQLEGGTAFATTVADRPSTGTASAIVRGRWKLVQTGDVFELFDVRADPDETQNVLASHGREATELRPLLILRQAAAKTAPF